MNKLDLIQKHTDRKPSVELLNVHLQVIQAALVDPASEQWGQLDVENEDLIGSVAHYLDLDTTFIQRTPQFACMTIRFAILYGLDCENHFEI